MKANRVFQSGLSLCLGLAAATPVPRASSAEMLPT